VLLLSQVVELTTSQVSILLHYQEEFRSLGFDFEQIGRNGVLLNSVPAFLPACCPEPAKLLEGIIEELVADSGKKITVDLEHAARIACHHAIKANDKLTINEAEELLVKLKKCRQGTLCPHGRPTMITFTVKEIEKMFNNVK
jgi:DNA mismatch repair protein MutL